MTTIFPTHRLFNKNVLVTGASGGIGAATGECVCVGGWVVGWWSNRFVPFSFYPCLQSLCFIILLFDLERLSLFFLCVYLILALFFLALLFSRFSFLSLSFSLFLSLFLYLYIYLTLSHPLSVVFFFSLFLALVNSTA